MKKQMGLITALFVMLLVLTSSPSLVMAQPTIGDLGHSWNDPLFAIVADVNQPKNQQIYLVKDILLGDDNPMFTETTDANLDINNNFFCSYINQSGMEVGYLALERLAKTSGGPLAQYNRTAPFQALFTHFTNDAGADVFVVVNFDGLLAYSGGGRHRGRLDAEDDIYLGLTFGGQGLADLLSAFYLVPNGLDPLPHWDVTPFFETTDDDSYSFGMTYHNLLVVWLSLTGAEEDYEKLGKELAGRQLRAISLFDNVTYRYDLSFETDETTGLTTASIAANYDFGSTDIIAIGYENTPDVEDGEEKAKKRLEEIRDDPETDYTGEVVNIPDLTPFKPEEHSAAMIYTDDLAKLRIHGPMDETPGFGLAVINSALIITLGDAIIEKDGKALDPEAAGEVGSVAMVVDNKKTFETDYKTKGDYKIVWANGTSRAGIPVFNTIIPARRRGFNVPYFILQRLILAPWLLAIAKELRKQQTTAEQVTAEHYFIASMFPFWNGGRILHDPTFTAYSNPEAVPVETTPETPESTPETPETTPETSETPKPVGEFAISLQLELLITAIVGLPVLLLGAKHRKRHR